MVVTVGGAEYEIGGIGWGTSPAWGFIKAGGQRMTRESFLALPQADKEELTGHVQAHIDRLGKSKSA